MKVTIIQLLTACLSKYKYIIPIPLRVMMLFWSGSIPTPSRHTTIVPLRSEVAVTVAVDVMNVPVLTSVTLNWNGGVRDHPTQVTRKKSPRDSNGWNTPQMSDRRNCTCECHSLQDMVSPHWTAWVPETEITHCLQTHNQDFLKGGYINVWYGCVYV